MTTSTKDAEGVHPDRADKPDSPGDMKKSSWGYVLKRTVSEFSKDQCTDLAAALTYYAVLALFPALIALMSLVGLVGDPKDTANTLIDMLKTAGVSSKSIETTIMQLSSSTGAGLALIIGLATALWSASGYVGSFGRAMNRVYEIDEGRPVWKLRPTMLFVTLVSVVLVALVLVGLVVSGPAAEAVGDTIGLGSTALTVWNIAKWPVMLAIVVFIVALLYYATPNIKQPKFRWLSVGALIAIVVWIIASALFGFYVANFSSYNKTYGALAGVIVFLLWLWLTNIALLFGAELDAELERGRQLQAGIAAEETVQLPVKDDKKIKKTDKKHDKVVAQAKALRESRGESQDPEKG